MVFQATNQHCKSILGRGQLELISRMFVYQYLIKYRGKVSEICFPGGSLCMIIIHGRICFTPEHLKLFKSSRIKTHKISQICLQRFLSMQLGQQKYTDHIHLVFHIEIHTSGNRKYAMVHHGIWLAINITKTKFMPFVQTYREVNQWVAHTGIPEYLQSWRKPRLHIQLLYIGRESWYSYIFTTEKIHVPMKITPMSKKKVSTRFTRTPSYHNIMTTAITRPKYSTLIQVLFIVLQSYAVSQNARDVFY